MTSRKEDPTQQVLVEVSRAKKKLEFLEEMINLLISYKSIRNGYISLWKRQQQKLYLYTNLGIMRSNSN